MFPASGLLLVVDHDGNEAELLAWRPAASDLAPVLCLLREAFPVVSESIELSSPDYICESKVPIAALLLATSEIIMRDFCTQPRLGRLLVSDQRQMRVFLPCDEAAIGTVAWTLSMEVAKVIPSFSGLNQRQLLAHLKAHYRDARQTAYHFGLNQSTLALARSALQRGIPHYRINMPGQLLQLGQGRYRKRVMETATDDTSSVGIMISRDKFKTASLLRAQGMPTPHTQLVSTIEEALRATKQLGFPVVVKPKASGKGKGVTVNITNEAELMTAIRDAAVYKSGIIVERYIKGDDHRLLVVAGRFIAAAKRLPAEITGDGQHTVSQLVAELNCDPRRGVAPFERLLEKVDIDQEAMKYLADAGLTPDSIPAAGLNIRLRGVANLSRGGTAIDVTEHIHPDNRLLAERAARLVGLNVTGIDFLTPDISQSWRDIPCAILEVNATPGLRPHMVSNPQRDVVGPIVEHLFPACSDGRVPTAGITGSVGKTTTCRMVASILSASGKCVALSTTQGAWVGEDTIGLGDAAGGGMASILLLDPRVEAGVFELSRGGLIKKGMTLDALDVGAVLNVYDNHIGLDGARSREDLARVKRLVVESARRMAVLNADDPLCLAMREFVTAPKLCLVSTASENPAVQAHQEAGGVVAYLDESGANCELRLYEGRHCIGSMPGAEIPATWGGRYRPSMINALFAMAIAHGTGVTFDTIRAALGSFQSTHATNPGRMNFVEDLSYQLCITWADGPVAMRELAHFINGLKVLGKKRLMFCSVGNRPDSFIVDMAMVVAGAFTDYICSDWENLRGRPAGEAAGLLARGLREVGVADTQINLAASHDEALDLALARSSAGDLLVMVTFSGEKAWQKAQTLAGH